MADQWNSVELARLAVAALTPLAVLGLGLIVACSTRRIEAIQYANQTAEGGDLIFERSHRSSTSCSASSPLLGGGRKSPQTTSSSSSATWTR
jgi:hypothetical protein